MPLSINVGLSRKASKDYQSTGVSINVTAELDSALLTKPADLQAQIDNAVQWARDINRLKADHPAYEAYCHGALKTGSSAHLVKPLLLPTRRGGQDKNRRTRHGGGTCSRRQVRVDLAPQAHRASSSTEESPS